MWNLELDPDTRTLPLNGFPLVVVILSGIFLAMSLFTVSFRSYIRFSKGIFGLDDAFMAAGTAVYTAVVGLAVYGSLVGLGRVEKDLNAWQWSEAMKYYIIFILCYVVSLAVVKSSVCLTILRIATTLKPLRICVWVLLGVTWCSFMITFVGTLLYCSPVRAIWTPALILSGEGSCAPVDTFVIIGHVATVSTIVTDLALVVVPGVLMAQTQMKRQAKIQAWGLLSFASVASIITMVRIPYVNKFKGGTDLQFWVAHTVLCSVVETGIGCTASSLPSLRHLIRRGTEGSSGAPSKRTGDRSHFFTMGSKSQVKGGTSSTDAVLSLRPLRTDGSNWQRLQDGDSGETMNKSKIYIDRTVSVDVREGPSTSASLDRKFG